MVEREPKHETIGRGELFTLSHPGTVDTFSGYGLTTELGRKDQLVGLLMVDRPYQADPEWLHSITETFGESLLVPMTSIGERGLLCRMQIEPDSIQHIRRYPSPMDTTVQEALQPLLNEEPAPVLRLLLDESSRAWLSEIVTPNELPIEIKEVLERTGYGCLAVESDTGIVHVCHASDRDIKEFKNAPVCYRWQLIEMPTAPLIRLELTVMDNPDNPYLFESFLNIAEEDQAIVLAQLANQNRLYLAFYADGLSYRYTKVIPHTEQQWQQLDEIVGEARRYYDNLPEERRDFNKAKDVFFTLSG